MSMLANVVASRRSAVVVSYLINEDFEGAGTPSGWTTSGTVDFDYATAPAPLAGAQSLRVYGAAWNNATKAFTASAEANAFFLISPGASSNVTIFSLRNNTTVICSVQLKSDRVTVEHGTTAVNSMGAAVTSPSAVWLRYVPGTGANGVLELWINKNSTSRTKPALSASISTGTATAQANNLICYAQGAQSWIFDDIKISSTAIGSNP